MNRQRLPLHPGDVFRSPAHAPAKWHRVIACRRRKDGTVYVAVKRDMFWTRLGLGKVHRMEMSMLEGIGYEVRK